jgi:hypothetical protein
MYHIIFVYILIYNVRSVVRSVGREIWGFLFVFFLFLVCDAIGTAATPGLWRSGYGLNTGRSKEIFFSSPDQLLRLPSLLYNGKPKGKRQKRENNQSPPSRAAMAPAKSQVWFDW